LRSILIDMIIPMASFAVLANYGKPFIGIVCAGLWSIFRVIWENVKLKKVPLFSLITIIFVFIEFVTFYIAENLYWFSLGIRSGLYGACVLSTLCLDKSLMQIIVEESRTTKFTEAFKETKYYRNCWRFVTAIFGTAYILKGLFFIYIAPRLDMGTAITIRMLLGGPLIIGIIAFACWFPHKYWGNEYKKGNITVQIIQN
jgi:hypothetical protein